MTRVYEVAGISKQALHQHRSRRLRQVAGIDGILEKADQIRKEHPGAGCRKMAMELRFKGMGRDKIEYLLLDNGYRVHYPRNYQRTTYAQYEHYYPNRIEGMELNDINQVIQTDITYYRVKEKWYYIVFIIDVYSRLIVGYSVSHNMEAAGNIKALKMMFKKRQGCDLSSLVHHSDRGGQFIDKEYRRLLKAKGIEMSMCKEAWENAYTERINRTIKYEYLNLLKIKDGAALERSVAKAVCHYNEKRTHSSLSNITPMAFEKMVEKLPLIEKPKMKIYKENDGYQQNTCE